MVKRLALSLFVAVALLGVNLPLPALGSTPQQHTGRVLINAPELPAVHLTPPALPAGAPAKQAGPVVKAGKLNHVNVLSSDALTKLHQLGMKVLDNRDGQWRVEANISGEDRIVTVVDGVLPSGREVVGFGSAPASSAAATGLVRALNVSAGTSYFFICSYAYQAYYGGDLYVHLCAVDANMVMAVLFILEAAVGGVVGALLGGPVGAIVGIAIGSLAGLITIAYFWTHMDSSGNVDIVIPNWTMLPPFGGYILWANSGRWDYMYDQCWVYEGQWYAPICSY